MCFVPANSSCSGDSGRLLVFELSIAPRIALLNTGRRLDRGLEQRGLEHTGLQ